MDKGTVAAGKKVPFSVVLLCLQRELWLNPGCNSCGRGVNYVPHLFASCRLRMCYPSALVPVSTPGPTATKQAALSRLAVPLTFSLGRPYSTRLHTPPHATLQCRVTFEQDYEQESGSSPQHFTVLSQADTQHPHMGDAHGKVGARLTRPWDSSTASGLDSNLTPVHAERIWTE